MCGINGLLVRNVDNDLANKIQAMNNQIIHRGPDSDGVFIDKYKIGLGMRRLSILDLSSGAQPMQNQDKSLTIIFNGEVYNYKSLKEDLQERGVIFRTTSDTEVILNLYMYYGLDAVAMLEGMFAFTIYDSLNEKTIIVRDRTGEKPLYYHVGSNKILWASELKSIINLDQSLKVISKESLEIYFSLSYIPAPYTIYQSIKKLEPGHLMLIDNKSLEVSIKEYWNLVAKISYTENNYKKAKAKVEELVFDSVEKCMISDVPIGSFLSGGVDSAIISSVMSKISSTPINTFTLGFESKRYDESSRASIISKHIKSNHLEFNLDYSEILEELDRVVLNFDEPFADPSCLPTYFIAKKTKGYVKVALTGDGGDEVFGGYNKYLLQKLSNIYKLFISKGTSKNIVEPTLKFFSFGNLDTKSYYSKFQKFINSLDSDIVSSHFKIMQLGFNNSMVKDLLIASDEVNIASKFDHQFYCANTFNTYLKKIRYLDFKISLEGDLLVKVDRASMLTSLECRAPFLNHKIIEYSFNLPDSFLLKGLSKKKILKDTFSNLVPNNYFAAPKSGFEIPIGYWFKNELKEKILFTLSKTNIDNGGLLNYQYVKNLIDEHISGYKDHTWRIWTLYCFQKWYNSNF